MSKKPFYKIIKFPAFDTKNGTLCMLQTGISKNTVPFKVRKILSITGMKNSDVRGGHTHHKTNQVLICASGECTVELDNGRRKKSIVLNKPNKGLVLYPYVWHTLKNFKKNTNLLVVADREYDEKEYIRNYEDFIQYIK